MEAAEIARSGDQCVRRQPVTLSKLELDFSTQAARGCFFIFRLSFVFPFSSLLL